jgi:hypothetical protein
MSVRDFLRRAGEDDLELRRSSTPAKVRAASALTRHQLKCGRTIDPAGKDQASEGGRFRVVFLQCA